MGKNKFLITTACVSALTLAACGGSKEKDILEESQEKMKALKSVEVEEKSSAGPEGQSHTLQTVLYDPLQAYMMSKEKYTYQDEKGENQTDETESEYYVTADGNIYMGTSMMIDDAEEESGEDLDWSIVDMDGEEGEIYKGLIPDYDYAAQLAVFAKYVDLVEYEEDDKYHLLTLNTAGEDVDKDKVSEALKAFAKESGGAVGMMMGMSEEGNEDMPPITFGESRVTVSINKETSYVEKIDMTLRPSMGGSAIGSFQTKTQLSHFNEADEEKVKVPQDVLDVAKSSEEEMEERLKDIEEELKSDDLSDEERKDLEKEKEQYEAYLAGDENAFEISPKEELEEVEKELQDEDLDDETRESLEDYKKDLEEQIANEGSKDKKDNKDE